MTRFLAIAVLCALSACSSSWKACHRNRPPGQSVAACEQGENDRKYLNDSQLRYLSSSHLSCENTAVAIEVVERRGRFPTVAVVSGCGKEAVYTRKLRHHQGVATVERTVWERDGLPRDSAR